MNGFGERLKELRKEKRLTQKQLADSIDQAQSAIFYWEKNRQEPTISALKKLCIFFNVSADYFIGLEDETGSKNYEIYFEEYERKTTLKEKK